MPSMDAFAVPLLVTLFLVCAAAAHPLAADAVATPTLAPTDYWQAVLPETPMPRAIQDLLTQSTGSQGEDDSRKVTTSYGYLGEDSRKVTTSYGYQGEDDSGKVTMSYGSQGEVDSRKITTSYGIQDEEDGRKATIGIQGEEDTRKATIGIQGEDDTRKITTSYGSQDEADSRKVTTSYGIQDEEDGRKATIGIQGEEDTRKATIEIQGEEDTRKVTTSYGSQDEEGSRKVTMSYGSNGEEDPRKATTSYRSQGVGDSRKVTMSYRFKGVKDSRKITTSYGCKGDKDSRKITTPFGFQGDEGSRKVTKSYGTQGKESLRKATTSYDRYHGGEDDATKPTKVTTSFGAKGEQDTKRATMSYGSHQSEEHSMRITMPENKQSSSEKDGASKGDIHDHDVHNHNHNHNHNNGNKLADVFFFQDVLRPGSVITPTIPPTTSLPSLLPRRKADALPFSTERYTDILAMFAPTSDAMGREIWWTLNTCENPRSLAGEKAACATSLESLAKLPTTLLGTRNVRAFSGDMPTDPVGTSAQRGRYNVTAVRKLSESLTVAACHDLTYPYAVFYCHTTNPATTYLVNLVAHDGRAPAAMEALVVCHLDTSLWSPRHPFLVAHNLKPGDAAVCHFLSKLSIVWVPVVGEQEGMREAQ